VKLVGVLLGKLIGKWPLLMVRTDREDYFTMALKEMSSVDRRLMELTQDYPQL
jgi:hypothetical protein